MPKMIKGKLYFLVDITYDDFFIYEIYEDENGKRFKRKIDYRRN